MLVRHAPKRDEKAGAVFAVGAVDENGLRRVLQRVERGGDRFVIDPSEWQPRVLERLDAGRK